MMRRTRGTTLNDEESLRAAYAAHGGELLGFAMRSLGDRQLAEDVVQETFVRAWRTAGRYDPELGSLRTWLFAIARHVIIDAARARGRAPVQPLAEADMEVVSVSGEADVDRVLASWQVEEALRRLSDDHRRVLVEVHYLGRPYADVARDLGIPDGTVKSRVYYALKALRLALEEMGVDG